MRKIIHVDMDAFFAAIEIREDPSLKGKCLIVGGSPNSRGVVSTCSYEARKFGVHSAMPCSQAWRLCPQAIFVRPNFGLYREASAQIREVLNRYTPLVEPVSLDEAYLDVTANLINEPDSMVIARRIKQEILEKTRLTCSVGVSFNKFLAKIGSELQKPDGLSQITPENAPEILFALPIGKFHGIGNVTAAKMQKMGIHTGADLYEWSAADLANHFGKMGLFFYNAVRGIDEREVISYREPKSISCEHTFNEDISDMQELVQNLKELVERLVIRMHNKQIQGKTIMLKIKYENFELITRSYSLSQSTADEKTILKHAQKLLVENWDESRKIRLLGVGLSRLDLGSDASGEQLFLDI
ncbi:MAG TPA: DNA polymerase IV [Candidatus Cloacimonetes bacterium]|jgi:DNA polymerase-4|nr:DNA polymerase IV [Candidatus Cloacimonas sp.]HHZ15236.1 DNA polymerase IV [Candidatus Cloacimonadota bacterium]